MRWRGWRGNACVLPHSRWKVPGCPHPSRGPGTLRGPLSIPRCAVILRGAESAPRRGPPREAKPPSREVLLTCRLLHCIHVRHWYTHKPPPTHLRAPTTPAGTHKAITAHSPHPHRVHALSTLTQQAADATHAQQPEAGAPHATARAAAAPQAQPSCPPCGPQSCVARH